MHGLRNDGPLGTNALGGHLCSPAHPRHTSPMVVLWLLYCEVRMCFEGPLSKPVLQKCILFIHYIKAQNLFAVDVMYE